MDGRGLRSAAIVGASLGGRIAIELALKHPQRVSKLVLVNSLGLGRPTIQLTYGLITLPRVGETVMKVARDALNWVPPPVIRRVACRHVGGPPGLRRTLGGPHLRHLRPILPRPGLPPACLGQVRALAAPPA